MKYTEEMLADLKSREKMNYNDAVVFASYHGLTVASVVAKISALGIPYTKKQPVKEKVPVKSDFTARINARLESPLLSLERMTLPDLAKLARLLDK